ncbi:RxLR effector protein [Phytophthora megakarya]|uniref:RxLR effector protein n=1 Tax=Phytophthora megakarya TaxID=4795 RepID=A0A225WD99_9STRA|nr:RxLR effector protein [Phytophthora megakarya]
MLLSAKEVESTKTFATKLEGIQIANWVKSGNSADDVFKALKLDQTGDKLFESPMFTYWSSFVAKRYSNNPGSEMFSTFGLHYTDEALAKILPTKILISAKNVDSTKAQATKLEGLQISNWINGDKSADDVFKLLKLDETGDELFKSPLFSTWTTFVTKINKNNYEADIFKLLTDKLGDAALARMISAANNVDDTKKLATGLRAEQFTSWFSAGKTPQNVDTLLNAAANSDDMTKKISQDYAKFFEKADERLSMVN